MATKLPVGEPTGFTPVPRPARVSLRGANVLVRPLNAGSDAPALYAASHPLDGDRAIWTYLPYGPYSGVEEMSRWLAWAQASDDPLFFTLARLPDGRALGVASYLRITPEFGVIELGHIWFGTDMQRTTAATEAIYLMARYTFDTLGYRRLEWKCDALNAGSRRAAERFGFTFEGIFRKHMVIKGRSRDSAWYSILDDQWPLIRAGFERWLAPENFDASGRQRQRLSRLIAQEPSVRDPASSGEASAAPTRP
jgi:RimJ/RimL family protein N-acetyltransferase